MTDSAPRAHWYAVALLGLILLSLLVNLAGSRGRALTIIYSGNLRGALLTQAVNGLKADRRLANFQETFAFLQELRQRHREKDNLVVLCGGDSLVGGDGLSEYFGGLPMAELLAAASCDAMAPGRLELGLGNLEEVAGRLPLLGTNLTPRPRWAQQSRVVQRGGLRVGVLSWFEEERGLIEGLDDAVAGFHFDHDRHLLSSAAHALQADLVVCLAAVDDIDALARDASGVDLMIPTRTCWQPPHKVGEVTVAPWVDGRQAIGEIAVLGQRRFECRVHRFGPAHPPSEPEVLRPYREKFEQTHGKNYAALRDLFLGLGAADLTHDQSRFGDSGAGDLLASLVRQRLHADVACINHRAIRGGFGGIVGFNEIYDGLPFFNEIVLTDLSPGQMHDLLQRNALVDGRYLQIGGLVAENRANRVATVDFLALGAHGHEDIINHGSNPLFSGLYLSLMAYDSIRERGLWTRPPREEVFGNLEACRRKLKGGAESASFYWRWGYPGRALDSALHDRSGEGRFWLGLVHRGGGRHQAARTAFEEAVRMQPQSAAARLLLGWEALETGDRAAAAQQWQAAARLRPAETRIQEMLALLEP